MFAIAARLEKLDRATDAPSWAKSTWDAARVSQWLEDPPPIDDPNFLYLRPDDFVESSKPISEEDFPDQLTVGQSKLPLEYHFEPGSDRDGIHVKVHQAALSQLSDDRLGWLVPGLLVPKLTAMIKSLPKRIRRNLVPAAEVAARIADELAPVYGTVPFMTAVCQAMSRHAEMPVAASDFQDEKMEDHLQFLVTVVDDRGKTLGEGRELTSSATSVPLGDGIGIQRSGAARRPRFGALVASKNPIIRYRSSAARGRSPSWWCTSRSVSGTR